MGYALGFICCLISSFGFGTNFLPVKKFSTGDSLAFSFFMSVAIFMVGLVVQFSRDSPPFEPFAVVGGVLWATGNLASGPVIQMIGLGLGMLLWCGSNLIGGWAIGYFGLLGVTKNEINYPVLNAIGALIAASSLILMFFVSPVKKVRGPVDSEFYSENSLVDAYSLDQPLNTSIGIGNSVGLNLSQSEDAILSNHNINNFSLSSNGLGWFDSLSDSQKRWIGCPMAIVAGLFYCVNFNPPQYLIDSGRGRSSASLDYVFSHFCGIFAASTFYFLVYCILKKNSPFLPNYLVLPSFLSGIGWGIAQVSWFVANENLGFSVAFPIITSMPGIIATLIGVIFYKEIEGKRNFILLGLAILVSLTGVAIITVSKIG